jgi:hypothetical protein
VARHVVDPRHRKLIGELKAGKNRRAAVEAADCEEINNYHGMVNPARTVERIMARPEVIAEVIADLRRSAATYRNIEALCRHRIKDFLCEEPSMDVSPVDQAKIAVAVLGLLAKGNPKALADVADNEDAALRKLSARELALRIIGPTVEVHAEVSETTTQAPGPAISGIEDVQ